MTECSQPMELPEWNEGLRQAATFSNSPPKKPALGNHTKPQPLPLGLDVGRVRATTKTAATAARQQRNLHTEEQRDMRIEGLHDLPNALEVEYWLNKAFFEEQKGNFDQALQILREALERDIRPATRVTHAMQELQKRMRTLDTSDVVADTIKTSPEPTSSQEELDIVELSKSGRKPTPSKTGLSGKAVRIPSRYAKTPGAAQIALASTAPPPTAFANVLKKLSFSAQKSAATAAQGNNNKDGTTTKQLRFDVSTAKRTVDATPASSNLAKVSSDDGGRHVTFGANTVSPEAGRKPRRFSFRTPEAAIPEGAGNDEEYSEDEEGGVIGGVSTVNSRNAGQTPYSKEMSALLKKYNSSSPDDEDEYVDEIYEYLADDETDELIPAVPSQQNLLAAGDISPGTGAVHLPLTTIGAAANANTIVEDGDEDDDEAFMDCTSDIDLSPRGGVDDVAAGLEQVQQQQVPLSPDGVPRDIHGIPLTTPGTVTVFRGGNTVARDDGLAQELFKSFSPSDNFEFSFPAAGGQQSSAGKSSPDNGDEDTEDAGTPEFQVKTRPATNFPQSASPIPASLLAAGGGSNTFGFAQRVPTPTTAGGQTEQPQQPQDDNSSAPFSVTREIRSLMRTMSLDEAAAAGSSAPGQNLGSMTMLSPSRATKSQKKDMGSDVVLTPVRRSARQHSMSPAPSAGGAVENMLEETDYAYAPNHALAVQQQQATAEVPVKEHVAKEQEGHLSSRRYATRSATKSRLSPLPPSTAASQKTASKTPQTASQRAAQRRRDLHLSVPVTPDSLGAANGPQGGDGNGPSSVRNPAGGIVPQDTSPELGESPTAAQAGRRSRDAGRLLDNILRSSAQRRASTCSTPGSIVMSPLSTSTATPASSVQRRAHSSSPATPDTDPTGLSPTERNIRETLRRSARRKTPLVQSQP